MWVFMACTDPIPPDTAAEKDTNEDSAVTTDTADTAETGDTTDTIDTVDSPETGETGETGDLPEDADGDGYPVEEDCDDTNATIHPGATETCDEVDRDCDGEPLADGVCGEMQDTNVIAGMFPDDYKLQLVVPDTNGDGIDDYFYTGSSTGVVPGGRPLDAYTTVEADGLFTWDTWPGCGWSMPEHLGDVDGDGISDLIAINQAPCNTIYIVSGPFPTDGSVVDFSYISAEYEASSYIYDGYDWTWLYDAQTADLDADGKLDVFASEPSEDVGSPLSFWFGGDSGQPSVKLGGGSGYGNDEGSLGDVDGDGADDLYVWAARQAAVLSGADMRGADGVPIEDLAMMVVPYKTEDAIGFIDDKFVDIGDVTDDGLDDLFINAYHSERLGFDHGEALLIEGGSVGDIDPSALAQSVGPPPECWGIDYGGGAGYPMNLDGAGKLEVRVQFCGNTYLWEIEMTGLLTEARGVGVLNMEKYSVGDTTGDGRDDLYWWGEDTPNGHLLTGWDVPWEDDRYW